MSPSTLHVLTNSPIALGRFDTCVSRSAMCSPLTPRSMASLAHSSLVLGIGRSSPVSFARMVNASFMSQLTMPGLAPQHVTQVGPPDHSLASPLSISLSG